MPVDLHGKGRKGMTQPLLDYSGMHTGTHQA